MKLHGAVISPNVRKVLAVLNIKEIEYDQEFVLPGTKTPEFLAISPRGFIPAFEDGAFNVPDSTVITEYLEETYPHTSVLPTSPRDRAKSRWLTEYAGSVIFPPCATLFNQLVLNPGYYKQATDEAAVIEAKNEIFPPIFDYLETQLPADGFLFGDVGLADISIVSPLINAEYAGFTVDESRWPKLAGLVERVKALPEFAKCVEGEKDLMKVIRGE